MAQQVTRTSPWQWRVLAGIGAPITAVNTHAMILWHESDLNAPGTAWHNPLSTSWALPGSSTMNKTGVQSYPSWTTGVRATILTLGQTYYVTVVAALRAGNTLGAIWRAINASPWCGGCQHGHYPIAMWNALGQPSGGGGGLVGTAGGPAGAAPATAGDLAQLYDMWAALHNWVQTESTAMYHGLQWIQAAMEMT